jgi:hypothetical protein
MDFFFRARRPVRVLLRVTKTRMALVTVVCVTAGFVINAAMDGGGPPRVRMRAEVAPLVAAVAAPPLRPSKTSEAWHRPATAPAHGVDPEQQLSASLRADSDADSRDEVLQKWLPEWLAKDPQAAARFAETQNDPRWRAQALHHVALLWGALDAERAVNWARALPDAADRDTALIDIANGLSSVDPARGVELREPFTAPNKPDSALSNLVQQWASYDFDAALAWTNARAPGAQRDELMQRLIYVRAAAGDPAAAARLVTESALAGEAKTAALASVNQEWEQRDANAAREWAQTLGPQTPD